MTILHAQGCGQDLTVVMLACWICTTGLVLRISESILVRHFANQVRFCISCTTALRKHHCILASHALVLQVTCACPAWG